MSANIVLSCELQELLFRVSQVEDAGLSSLTKHFFRGWGKVPIYPPTPITNQISGQQANRTDLCLGGSSCSVQCCKPDTRNRTGSRAMAMSLVGLFHTMWDSQSSAQSSQALQIPSVIAIFYSLPLQQHILMPSLRANTPALLALMQEQRAAAVVGLIGQLYPPKLRYRKSTSLGNCAETACTIMSYNWTGAVEGKAVITANVPRAVPPCWTCAPMLARAPAKYPLWW
ncbi:hypothetical protein BDZ91DRAFT_92637 [Kalaharituber pfeilii]|nr:hypothetical protein BDZ91DRAFT_92637 [Kalaharituber pfeilii]